VFVLAAFINIAAGKTLTLSAVGGVGGAAVVGTSVNVGGGGGGGGGQATLIYGVQNLNSTGVLTLAVTGGLGGAPAGTGATGATGATGTTLTLQM
jgi:hypothetical protein